MSTLIAWAAGRCLEIVIGTFALVAWRYADGGISQSQALVWELRVAVAACITFQVVTGYLATSLFLAHRMRTSTPPRVAGAGALLFALHFGIFALVAGGLELSSPLVLFALGAAVAAVANYAGARFVRRRLGPS